MLIGVYRSEHPARSLTRDRLDALVKESVSQNVTLAFFDDEGIDFKANTVTALSFARNRWIEKTYPLPKVVINESPLPYAEQTEKGRKLAHMVKLTTHLIHGKLEIYRHMLKSPALAPFVMPFEPVTGLASLIAFMDEHPHAILKPDMGKQGASVIYIKRIEEEYIWQEGDVKSVYRQNDLERRLASLISNQVFLIQPYQECLTSEGRPFDFRIHVQRDGEGQWSVTKVYPRIGEAGTIVSNLGKGGETEPLSPFLQREFPNHFQFMEPYLKQIGLETAQHLNAFYEYDLDELGIDFAIDHANRTWFYEANTSPSTRFHELERAQNVIAYAKYLAEGQTVQPDTGTISDRTSPITIGMLASVQIDQSFAEACASVAHMYGAAFYYFHPKNVLREEKKIRGRIFENGAWVKTSCPYPDVVYDRFKRRGVDEYEWLYEELSNIPFTHELPSGSMSKERVYEWLKGDSELSKAVIPYVSVNDEDTMIDFIERNREIVIKPSIGSHGRSIIIVRKLEEQYELFDQQFLHYLSKADFRAFLSLFCRHGFVAQRYIESVTKERFPFHLRVHLMRDGHNEWKVVFVQPFVSLSPIHQVTNHKDTLRLATKWDWFLSSQYAETVGMDMDQKVKSFALAAVNYLQAVMESRCHEIALDLGVDSNRDIWLFEGNFNQIGNTFHGFEAARFAIPYSISLVRKKESQADQPDFSLSLI